MNTSIAVAPINAPNSSIVSLGPIQAVRKPPAQLHRGARHCAVQLAFRGAGQRMDRIVEACTRYRQTAPDRNRLRYVGLDRSDLRHRAACGLLLGEVPVWGIPSTLLLVPVLPLFIGGSVLVAVAGALATEPVVAVSVIALGLGNYMSFIANTFASLTFGTVNAANEVSIALMAAWYGVLFALLHRRALSAIKASDGRFPQHWNRWNNCHRHRAEPEKKSIHIHSDRCLADRGRFTDWLRPHGFVTP